MTLPASARALIESGSLAHLGTTNADGSPQVSVVWAGVDGDGIVIAHMGSGAKIRNIERDPRVVLSFESDESNEIGMKHTLIVHGEATLTEGGAPELLQQLARVYVAPGAVFPPFPNPPAGHVIHVRVLRVGGVGPWVEG
jgi:PPOX class probable F420-dependent enzyme